MRGAGAPMVYQPRQFSASLDSAAPRLSRLRRLAWKLLAVSGVFSHAPRARLALAAVSAACLVNACGGGTDEAEDRIDGGGQEPTADASGPGDPGDCDAGVFVAYFRLTAAADHPNNPANLYGAYFDRTPFQSLAPLAEQGGCAFIGYQPVLCEPSCQDPEQCDLHATCRPYETGISAGTLQVSGTTPEFTAEPVEFIHGLAYSTGSYAELYRAGDPVTLSFEGDDAPALTLSSLGVPRLEVPTTAVTAVEHEPMTLEWSPVAVPDDAEVVVKLQENHHGGVDYVECVAPASAGALTIPANILDRVIAQSGLFGIEQGWISLRRRSASETDAGCAAFDTEHTLSLQVETVRAR